MNNSLDAKIRAAMVDVAQSAPTAPSADDLGIGATLPMYAPAATIKPSVRTRLTRSFAAIGIVVGGAGLAVVAANSGDDKATPEAAFETFVDALSDEDPIGLLEAIDPVEREALRPGVESVLDELNRLGLLENVSLDGQPLSAFDVEIVDLDVAATNLGSNGVTDLAAIRIVDGNVISRTDPATIPVGRSAGLYSSALELDLQSFAGDFDDWANGIDEDVAANDLEFVMIERDGEWFVNIGYTVMDIIGKYNGWGTPDYGNELQPNGQASPEEAAAAWLRAAPYDFAERVALLDPEQVPALYDYATSIDAAITDDFYGSDAPTFDVTVGDLGTSFDGERLTISTYELSYAVTDNGENFDYSLAFDGRCVSSTSQVDVSVDYEACVDDPELGDDERAFLESLSLGFTLVERNGLWYVDPVRTFAADIVSSMAPFAELTETNRDMFAGSILTNSIFNDFFGLRSLLAFRSGSATLSGELGEIPPAMECTEKVYMAIYDNGIGAVNLDLPEAVIADYDACVAELSPEELAEFAPMTLEEIVAEARCSSVFQEVWGDDLEVDPPQDKMAAAEAEFEACLEAATTTE